MQKPEKMLSNGAPVHNHGPGTIKFHKHRKKINTEGRASVFQFLSPLK